MVPYNFHWSWRTKNLLRQSQTRDINPLASVVADGPIKIPPMFCVVMACAACLNFDFITLDSHCPTLKKVLREKYPEKMA